MRWFLPLMIGLMIGLAGCAPIPDVLEDRITSTARAADLPVLIPLGPVILETDTLLPEDPGAIARALEARAADLRRRAAILRSMPLG